MRVLGYVDRERFIESFVTGKRVLDCGAVGMTCFGAGDRLEYLPNSLHWRIARSARETIGIDTAADVVAAAVSRYPDVDLRAVSITEADTALAGEPPFDVVVLGDIVEHLDNPGRALEVAAALLRPAGNLIVTCPNAFGLPNYLRFLSGRFREGRDHVATHNKWTLTQLLARHGFEVDGVWTALDRPPRSPWRRRSYALLGVGLRRFPELGGTLVVVAHRDPVVRPETKHADQLVRPTPPAGLT
jgi:SAM-dependent methyltransferase